MTARLEQTLASWPDWPLPLAGRPQIIEAMRMGRTNQSYRLKAPGLGNEVLLRLHHPDSKRLGIDRALEKTIVALTAEAGLSRPAWHWDIKQDFSLFPFIEARPWTLEDFADPDQRRRLWPMIERLASLDAGLARRRYSDYLLRYWQQLEARTAIDDALIKRWEAFWPDLLAFDASDWSACLSHHDLVPANVLDTGDQLILIDWEYASMGHRDIDRWSLDPSAVANPFIGELIRWLEKLWERLIEA